MDISRFSKLNGAITRISSRPGLAAGVGATALFAPFAVRDDQRGYLSSSLITSPLVLAAAVAGQEAYRGSRAAAGVFNRSRLRPGAIFQPTPLTASVEDLRGATTVADLERMASAYYQRGKTPVFDLSRHHKQALKSFE